MRTFLQLLLLVVAVIASPIKDEDTREMQELESLLRRVIGGDESKLLSAPWLVALQAQYKFNETYNAVRTCGGSVITRQWILTAAHCFEWANNPKFWKIHAGEKVRESSSWDKLKGLFGEILGEDELKDWLVEADKIMIHPLYDPESVKNDIALVRLSKPLPVDPNNVEAIQQVEIASALDPDFPQDDQECMFAGWGCDKKGGGPKDVAFEVMLPKVNDTFCIKIFENYIQTFTRFCAGHMNKGMGICPGDSGGPLVCKKGNKWVQAGIASLSNSNALGNRPGLFTRVSFYSCWIKETINNNKV